LKEPRTKILRPVAAGYYTNITYQYPDSGYHWDKVADDNDPTYIYKLNQGYLYDSYKLEASLIPASSTINSVTVYFRCSGATASWDWTYYKPFLRLGTNDTYGSEVAVQGLNPPWTLYNQTLDRPGGGNWTVADLADLEVGIGLAAQYQQGNRQSRCTRLYVEIDYIPVLHQISDSVRNNTAVRSLAAARNLPDC
jgi:hypothetical protein